MIFAKIFIRRKRIFRSNNVNFLFFRIKTSNMASERDLVVVIAIVSLLVILFVAFFTVVLIHICCPENYRIRPVYYFTQYYGPSESMIPFNQRLQQQLHHHQQQQQSQETITLWQRFRRLMRRANLF